MEPVQQQQTQQEQQQTIPQHFMNNSENHQQQQQQQQHQQQTQQLFEMLSVPQSTNTLSLLLWFILTQRTMRTIERQQREISSNISELQSMMSMNYFQELLGPFLNQHTPSSAFSQNMPAQSQQHHEDSQQQTQQQQQQPHSPSPTSIPVPNQSLFSFSSSFVNPPLPTQPQPSINQQQQLQETQPEMMQTESFFTTHSFLTPILSYGSNLNFPIIAEEWNHQQQQLQETQPPPPPEMMTTEPFFLPTILQQIRGRGLTNDEIAEKTRRVRFSSLVNPLNTICPIRHESFEESDDVIILRNCRHIFYEPEILQWFSSHSTCPSCRQNLLQSS